MANTGSWSLLKNATTNENDLTASVQSNSTVKPVDSFQKYKMQLLEKEERERLLKEQKSSAVLKQIETDSKAMSPPTTNITTQLSPTGSFAFEKPEVQFSPPQQTAVTPVVTAENDAALKRVQSIQEMRENERRKREELAGNKIDMTEQHKLIAQFEKNLMPPS